MSVQIMIQGTPNPNALKFVLDKPVKTRGNVTYRGKDSAEGNPLAQAVFEVSPHVKEVYFFDNYITVTQDGEEDWDELEDRIKKTIQERFADHDPDFSVGTPQAEAVGKTAGNAEIDKIETVLDQTIRPALQMDGGDVRVVRYEQNTVEIFYQGACGSCPSATMGTLYAIENILREQIHPDIRVVLADPVDM